MGRRTPHFARCDVLAAGVAASVVAAASASAAVPTPGIAPGTAAATADHDDDQDDPQAGVVSVVKAHTCHLALRHSMRPAGIWSLAIGKFLRV